MSSYAGAPGGAQGSATGGPGNSLSLLKKKMRKKRAKAAAAGRAGGLAEAGHKNSTDFFNAADENTAADDDDDDADAAVAITAEAPPVTSMDDVKFISKPAIKWTCDNCNTECIPVRGQSRCLCGHRYHEHKPDKHGRFKCSRPGCKCHHFFFVVAEGAWILRCRCKHKHTDHDPSRGRHPCKKRGCDCSGFDSPWVCNCGCPWSSHTQSTKLIKFVQVNGREMPASLFAQMVGVAPHEMNGGIAPEINNVRRDPLFGQKRY